MNNPLLPNFTPDTYHDDDHGPGSFPCPVYPTRGHADIFTANICAIVLEQVIDGTTEPPTPAWAQAQSREALIANPTPKSDPEPLRARRRRRRFITRTLPALAVFAAFWTFVGPVIPVAVTTAIATVATALLLGIFLAAKVRN